jgi:hypothetical protein
MKTIYRIPNLTGENSEIFNHLVIFKMKIEGQDGLPVRLRRNADARGLTPFKRLDLGEDVWQMVDRWKAQRNIDMVLHISPNKRSRIEEILKYSIKELDAIIRSMDMAREKKKALIQAQKREEEAFQY